MTDEVRLIDANALRLMKVAECAGHTIEFAEGWKSCVEYCKNDAPAIEAEPVKHGRWIRGENKGFPEKPSMIWYCSVCGERIRYNDTLRKYQKIKKSVSQINPRCRNCGARMDGDSDDQPSKPQWQDAMMKNFLRR